MEPVFVLLFVFPLFPSEAATQQGGRESEIQAAIEEFKTMTRSLGLRGDAPGRAREVRRRPQWHGRLFENFRNDALDAAPKEITQRGGTKNMLRRNQFGFNLSGPVYIPKVYHGGRSTFFSVSYEGVRERIGRSYLRTIPTMPERTGDYSAVVDPAGNRLPIYDPETTRENPNFNPALPVTLENLQFLRDPFPGNRIPAHRLDPVAQRALTLYPAPNTDVGPFFRNNYFIVSPEINSANGMIAKVDHTVREKHRFAVDASFSNGFNGAAPYFPTAGDSRAADRVFASRRASAEHVFTISPQTVHTASFEVVSSTNQNVSESTDFAARLGVGSAAAPFPRFYLGPYVNMGRVNPDTKYARNTFVVSDGVSTRRGKHNLRVSGNIRQYQVNSFVPRYPSGSFRFSPGLTSLPGIVNTGHAFASFLLGLPEHAEVSLVASPSYFRRTRGLITVRDQYEIAKGLMLTLGGNLEVATPRVEKFDRQSTVDLETINPENGRPGALIAAGHNGVGRAFQPTQIRAEPRVSIAWSPRGITRNVVRLNYARSYSTLPIYSSQFGTQGFNLYETHFSPNVQLAPAMRFSQGVPPPRFPPPDLRREAANFTVADLIDRSKRVPTYQSASLSVERELPGSFVATGGFAYSGGRNLLVSNSVVNPNAIRLEALEYRDELNNEMFRRTLRPYPQYLGFNVFSSWPLGRYMRNAGYVRIEKRASKGLTLNGYYEFSRQMDDYSGPYGRQDYYNRRNEWALTAGNNPHRLSFSYVYELPVGPNKPFFSYSDWRRVIVDGWSVSGMTTFTSGEPLALRPQFNNTGTVVDALNVNVVPGEDPRVKNPSAELWFNPAAFEQPPDFTIGNASRTHPTLRAPISQNHDLSVIKRFALAPDRTLELSAAGFNFVNHANWNDPDTVIGPATAPNVNAGKIIGSRGGRVIQLGLRYSF
ncbi:MAG: hypothetical protein ACK5AZ_10640 [Bryobacteraceae bacterium]